MTSKHEEGVFIIANTMVRITTIICLVLSTISVTNCKGRKVSLFSYLDLPSKEQFDDDFHQSIGKALLRVDFELASRLVIVQKALREAHDNERTSSKDRAIYRQMLDLSEASDECSNDLLEVYQSVWAQMMANFGHGLGRYYTYMRVLGMQRFEHCAERASMDFSFSSMMEPAQSLLKDFGELFKKTLDLDEESDLHDKLKELDIATDRFDARRMVHAVEKLDNGTIWLTEDGVADDFIKIKSFMLNRCELINETETLARTLSMIAWARCLQSEAKFDTRLLMLEEYRRLCLAWIRPDSRKRVEENVRSQLV